VWTREIACEQDPFLWQPYPQTVCAFATGHGQDFDVPGFQVKDKGLIIIIDEDVGCDPTLSEKRVYVA
jgi:hypothetical protein